MRKNLFKLLLCMALILLIPISVYAEPLNDVFDNINYNALSGVATLDVGDYYFYEVEYNDHWDTADVIGHDYTVYGTLDWGDLDVFKFYLEKPSEVTIGAASLDSNFFLVLTDANGNELDQSIDLGLDEGFYTHGYYNELLAAGTYYVIALNDIDATDEYLFYLEIIPHSHNYTSVVTVPTCAAMGYTTHTCSCGDSYIDTYTPMSTEHTYSNANDLICNICGYEDYSSKDYSPMYRMYNPYTGEHFYTGSQEERNTLVSVGWLYEGIGFFALKEGGIEMYRLYNPYAGDHHYTASVAERDMLVSVGWIYEGLGWRAATASNGEVQYRLFNPYAVSGTHHYTGSTEERDMLVSAGWLYEGIGFYGYDVSKAE